MKYHAIITIVDDENNEITRIVKDEERRIFLSSNNLIIHEFRIGPFSISECCELRRGMEEGG